MRAIINIIVIFTVFHQTFGFSKYGRTCKDIGCPSSEVCVIAEDPCSYYNREQCGTYPTCKTIANGAAPSCATYTCPPTQICQLDNGTPKCVPEKTSSTSVHKNENTGSNNPSYPSQNPSYPPQNPSYPPQNPSYPPQNPSYPPQNPSYPGQSSGGGLYPSLTTSRPSYGGGYPSQSGGYAGGAPNSGYPGYPQQGNNNRGYPSQGYPGYPSQGNSGYPNQGYPSQGRYPNQGYPQYPGYQNQYNNRPASGQPQGSGSNPLLDKITDQLKTIGLLCVLVKYLTVQLTGL